MIQSCLIFAGLLIVTSAQSASFTVPGPCASIGYNTSCCPPWGGGACLANDGDCSCGADCYIFDDCCQDVHCPSRPRTCADIGITHCCNDMSGRGLCNVHDRHTDYRCSCDVSCHARNDCCPDAKIFCKPCYNAGKYPECCYSNRDNASACFAPEGNCYCDPSVCKIYGDCCADAQSNSSQCSSDGSSPIPISRLQSSHKDRSFSRRRFYNRERRIYRHGGSTNYAYQEAPAARVQQEFVNERKFRSRPRVAGRPSA